MVSINDFYAIALSANELQYIFRHSKSENSARYMMYLDYAIITADIEGDELKRKVRVKNIVSQPITIIDCLDGSEPF
jgi:hypothetical protein